MQDGSLETIGKILDRMAELRTMAQDITKNTGDIENYTKEFVELQGQLKQIKGETFNGVSLFAANGETGTAFASANESVTEVTTNGTQSLTFDKYSRTLYTHPSGQTDDGSISLNLINLEFVLSIGSLSSGGDANLGNIGDGNATATANDGIGTNGFIDDILELSVGQLTRAIERVADARAENGAEQNRALGVLDMLESSLINLEAAHGRIMDADIALESTRFARHNVLVQAGAAMTAQANQLTNVALALLG
tara:strand:- start:424 stop:1179 length:756 start_codon:yes stop_codon:yes gene_type:complete